MTVPVDNKLSDDDVFALVGGGNPDHLRAFLDKNPQEVSRLCMIGLTPLQTAVITYNRSVECVRVILEAGANPNASGLTGCPPLCSATGLQTNASVDTYPSIARLLVAAGADVEGRQQYGWTALVEALMARSKVEVQVLLELGAEPLVILPKSTAPSFLSGLTSLEIAFSLTDSENFEALLRAGADVAIRDGWNRTLRDFAQATIASSADDKERDEFSRLLLQIPASS